MSKYAKRFRANLASLAFAVGLAVVGACHREDPPNPATPASGPVPKPLSSSNPQTAWFENRTEKSGVTFICRTGEEADRYSILESLGGGVGLFDYDQDGRLDVFFAGGGSFDGDRIVPGKCRLYRNLGNWKFQDVTAETGLDAIDFYSHGVAVADIDRDGFPDLAISGYGQTAIFRNESRAGKRCFRRLDQKAISEDRDWRTSLGFADLTGSGFPDLYVCGYTDWSMQNDPHCAGAGGKGRDVCGPSKFKPQAHALFRNEHGEFRRLEPNWLRKDGYGLGVVLADVNDDGKPDIYVANDAYDNFLYLNRGSGTMEEVGASAGAARDAAGLYNGSMGVDVADFEGNGRAGLWVTNFQGDNHALYRNLGKEQFLFCSHALGIAALGQAYVGFGTGFFDFDNDGWEDLVVANGHVLRNPSGSTQKQRPVLMQNVAKNAKRFYRIESDDGGEYFRTPTIGRGLAIGDLDNDGWPDVVITHSNAPAVLLRNQHPARDKNRWIGFQLKGKGERDIVGSKLVVETGTRTLTRFIKGGGSYLSASDPRALVGLGEAGECRRVTVHWSWGEKQTWTDLETGKYWNLYEQEAKAQPALVK